MKGFAKNEKIWYCAYRFHFKRWSNGFSFQSLPSHQWHRMLVQAILARRQWSHYGKRHTSKQLLTNASLLKPLPDHQVMEGVKPSPEHIANDIASSATEDETDMTNAFQWLLRYGDDTRRARSSYYVFDHITATTGVFAVSTLLASARNCDIILWTFPDWKVTGRFTIPQVDFPDQETLADISWKQRLLVTRLHRTRNEQQHCFAYRIYNITNMGLRLITTLTVPLEHFEHHLAIFTCSNEIILRIVDNKIRYSLKWLDSVVYVWSTHHGGLIAKTMMTPGLSVQSIVFTPTLNDESYTSALSRLFIGVYSISGYSLIDEACIYNFSANTPNNSNNNEFSTSVSVVATSQSQASKRNNDTTSKHDTVSVVNSYHVDTCEIDWEFNYYPGMRNAYKHYVYQSDMFKTILMTQENQALRLDMIDTLEFAISSRSTPVIVGSLLFKVDDHHALAITDLDNHEIICYIPCEESAYTPLPAGNDIILVNGNGIRRVAIDGCNTLESVLL
ncbi:hypothetical protein BDF22DRAFT_746555 [Syncephalis plumigaleata]|nr:hypothetical protein BDF22DRAFT_746555 [Syncephalis plumigaleata]